MFVGQDDPKSLGHLVDVRAAADVEKVGRLAAVQFDEVHRTHRQAGAIHQAADVAVELHIAKAGVSGSDLGFVFFCEVAQAPRMACGGRGRCRRK